MNTQENNKMEKWDDLMKKSIQEKAPSHLEDSIMSMLQPKTSPLKIKSKSNLMPFLFAGGLSLFSLLLWLISTFSSTSYSIPDQYNFSQSLLSFIKYLDFGLGNSSLILATLAIISLLIADYAYRSLSSKRNFS